MKNLGVIGIVLLLCSVGVSAHASKEEPEKAKQEASEDQRPAAFDMEGQSPIVRWPAGTSAGGSESSHRRQPPGATLSDQTSPSSPSLVESVDSGSIEGTSSRLNSGDYGQVDFDIDGQPANVQFASRYRSGNGDSVGSGSTNQATWSRYPSESSVEHGQPEPTSKSSSSRVNAKYPKYTKHDKQKGVLSSSHSKGSGSGHERSTQKPEPAQKKNISPTLTRKNLKNRKFETQRLGESSTSSSSSMNGSTQGHDESTTSTISDLNSLFQTVFAVIDRQEAIGVTLVNAVVIFLISAFCLGQIGRARRWSWTPRLEIYSQVIAYAVISYSLYPASWTVPVLIIVFLILTVLGDLK